MSKLQHKFEKVETSKIICGECTYVWYERLHKVDDIETCPECGLKTEMVEVQHIITKGSV